MKKLLIVDDEPAILEIMTSELKYLLKDFEVHSTLSSKEALALIEINEYDLVSLDYRMPDLNGMEIVSKVREQMGSQSPQFIMVTGEDIKLPSESGIKVFSKPFDCAEISTYIQELVTRTLEAKREAAPYLEPIILPQEINCRCGKK